jgi:hypothetical protein
MRALPLALFALIGCGGSTAPTDTTTDSSTTDTATVDTAAETRPTGSIKCGMGSCNAASEECCVGLSGTKCVMIGGCGGGTPFSCSDNSVCKTGEVCCAMSLTSGSKCATSCTGYVLCATDAECTDGKKCLNGLGGTKYCGMMMMSDGGMPG